jgi:MscS family membrane protein
MVYRLWSSVILTVGKAAADKSESKLDDRLYPLFEKIGGIVILIAGAFYIIDALGFDTTFFAAGGAIVSLVIAFAAQDTLGNFFSGVFLLLDQPFEEGDDIQIETGEVCRVESIGLRSTKLLYKANHEHFIMPNNMLANARIVNLLRPDRFYKVNVPIGVAYGSDVQLVKSLLMKVVDEHPLVLKDDEHKPWVWFLGFGDSALDFKVYAWVGDVYQRFQVMSDLCEAIDHEFRVHQIDIPFPQRTISYLKDPAPPAEAGEKPVPVGPGEDHIPVGDEDHD